MTSNGTADLNLALATTTLTPTSSTKKRSRSESPDRASQTQLDASRPRYAYDDIYIQAYAKLHLPGEGPPPSPQLPQHDAQIRPHMPMPMHFQMQKQQTPAHGALPAWDPKALLNPKVLSAPSAPSGSTATANPRASRPATTSGIATAAPVFQFSSPSDDLIVLAQDPDDEQLPRPNANGVGAMIERINNVEGRSSLPSPKRRKTVDEHQLGANVERITAAARGGSSGMLAGYLKDNVKMEGATGAVRPTPSRPPVTQMVDLTDSKDDDAEVQVIENPLLQEVCFGMLDAVPVNCHRVPAPRPGVITFGGDGYWPVVKTVLRLRKKEDSTSVIEVADHTRVVFGRLDTRVANGLVRLLDLARLQMRTDCRIPTRKKIEDEVVGEPISRSYKMEIVLYGLLKYKDGIGRELLRHNLHLRTPPIVPRGIELHNPHAGEPITSLSSPRQSSGAGPYTYSAPQTVRTVEDVRADVLTVFDSLKAEDLPQMEPSPLIVTELLPHQKQALYFMTARENPNDDDEKQRKHIRRLWKRQVHHGGQVMFYHVVTGQAEPQEPPPTLGGILADMMGLGKTLSILALIVSSQDKALEWAEQPPQQPEDAREKRKAKPNSIKFTNANKFNAPTAPSLGLTRLCHNAKTTLLVCPLSTVANWEEQLKTHVKADGLSYHIYHGPNREKNSQKLAKFDLVITTYGSVSSELTARNKNKSQLCPLEEIGWFRIVLDEAHMIREQSTLQFKAICRLQANRRWAVTGTPVQNRLDDLAALLAFIRLRPFDDRNKFNQFIVVPFKAADTEIIPKLRALVDCITLRRLKDKIHLPPRTDQVVKLQFSPEERSLYSVFERNAKERVKVLTGTRERIVGGRTYIHILQSILRLRLICAHGRDLLSDEDLKAVQGMTQESAIDLDSDDEDDNSRLAEETAYKHFDLMKDTNSDTCVVCQRKLGSPDATEIEFQSERGEDVMGYMTPCFHLCCPRCVRQFRDEETGAAHNSGLFGMCPFCSERTRFSVMELRHTRADGEHEDSAPAASRFRSGNKPLGASSSTSSLSSTASGPAPAAPRGPPRKNRENYSGPHTKTRALVEDLLRSKTESEEHPDEAPIKSVVFSGWTSHLDLIQFALDDAGIKSTRLDGKMTRAARSDAMETFRDDDSVHVILVSIMAGGLGLNLTAGSRVYVMEPQYNPAAEAQAIDRVHRLGQKRPVRTVRYIMENSFEEQMVALQDKKIQLASLSMDRGDKTMDKREAARQKLVDLKTLFK